MRLLPLILLATACAATDAGPSRGEGRLARELADRSAGEPRACIPVSSGANLVPRGRQDLVIEQGGTIWVNRLAAPCPGLDETSQIVIELHGDRYCKGDHFQAAHVGQGLAGPVCILGSFTPYRR